MLLKPEERKYKNGPAQGSRSQKEVAAKKAEYGEDTVAGGTSGHQGSWQEPGLTMKAGGVLCRNLTPGHRPLKNAARSSPPPPKPPPKPPPLPKRKKKENRTALPRAKDF